MVIMALLSALRLTGGARARDISAKAWWSGRRRSQWNCQPFQVAFAWPEYRMCSWLRCRLAPRLSSRRDRWWPGLRARFRIEKRLPMKTAHPTQHLNRSGRGLRPTEIGDAFHLSDDSWLTRPPGRMRHHRRLRRPFCAERGAAQEPARKHKLRSSNAFPRWYML